MSARIAELDLDGEALREYWTEIMVWLRWEAEHRPRRRVLDLGAGTGNATIPLAQRFGDAEVFAVDAAPEMLGAIRDKALTLGLAGRIRTVQIDLDTAFPELADVDVTFASMSLHHLADPDALLRRLWRATAPGGIVAVAEFAEPLRFLPDDLAALEERVVAPVRAQLHAELPALGADWSARLDAAGFAVCEERTFAIDVASPEVRRYAQAWFAALRSRGAEHHGAEHHGAAGHGPAANTVADADLAALEDALRERDDLRARGTRTVTLARRPR